MDMSRFDAAPIAYLSGLGRFRRLTAEPGSSLEINKSRMWALKMERPFGRLMASGEIITGDPRSLIEVDGP